MSTTVEVTVVSKEGRGHELIEEAFQEIKRLEGILNEWMDQSEIGIINKKAGVEPVRVGPDVLTVVSAGQRISRLSGGAFDVTWAALRHVWDFNRSPPRVPSKKEIKKLLPLVDYRKVVIDEKSSTVFLPEKGMEIGLGGIAKGYAVGRAAAILKAHGAVGGLINLGGNMMIWGRKENGKPWTIGVQDPRESERLLAVLRITEGSVSTSGDYERFFVVNGKRYHHIIDPGTGFPAEGCRSATVLCQDPTDADAISKVPFIMGPKKGLRFVEEMGCQGLVVDSDGNVVMTEKMKTYIQ